MAAKRKVQKGSVAGVMCLLHNDSVTDTFIGKVLNQDQMSTGRVLRKLRSRGWIDAAGGRYFLTVKGHSKTPSRSKCASVLKLAYPHVYGDR